MAVQDLREQLAQLRLQLDSGAPMSAEDRSHLEALAQRIEAQLQNETSVPDANVVDGVNLAVERFEVEHPTLAVTLRNIMQSLVSMGV
ncbi:DUF4404 family protein [Pseudomonas mangiferae]|uniref:DUF4404 family protein n=1 Tax=Pseudomonas mangiferae TaxID=2593654 RepID=A0A553GZU6_9PSED|nr:DUF4404 family protein [Pseudomonas mangiferae]TRX74993.1 DUF4404 family protein [Pseudomonas mangiferae]